MVDATRLVILDGLHHEGRHHEGLHHEGPDTNGTGTNGSGLSLGSVFEVGVNLGGGWRGPGAEAHDAETGGNIGERSGRKHIATRR